MFTATYGVNIKLEQLQIHGPETQWTLPMCSLLLTLWLPAENCLNGLFPGPSPLDRGTGTADRAPVSFQQQGWNVRWS